MKIPTILRSWTTPVQLTIVDARLGLLAWFLKTGILLYTLLRIAIYQKYQFVERPDTHPTFWFSSGGLQNAQNGTAPYCTDKSYEHYLYDGNSFWNDMNISCARMDYGDILKIGPTYAHVSTYTKQTHTMKQQCTGHRTGCDDMSVDGDRVVASDKTSDGLGGFICRCGKLRDRFVLGVDEMEMSLQHRFTTSVRLDEIGGSSTATEATKNKKMIKSCIKRYKAEMSEEDDKLCSKDSGIPEKDFGKCCKEVFQPGQTITKSVKDWVSYAGTTLDVRLDGQATPSARGLSQGLYPMHRISGVKIDIDLKYYGRTEEDTIISVIQVGWTDGWTEFGSDLTYLSYSPAGPAEYYDDYKRGVRFTFYPKGAIATFDWGVALAQLIAGLVALSYVDQAVTFVACYLVPEKQTYSRAKTEKLVYENTVAKFGVNCALACTAFRQWDESHSKNDGVPRRISVDELIKVYKDGGCLPPEIAEKLAKAVMLDKSEIACEDLVKLMSTGLVSLDRLDHELPQARSTKVSAAWS